MAIEIMRGNQNKPVAYLSQGCGAVYWPGKNGKCLSQDGTEKQVDYSGVSELSWATGYTPLYKGDTIRITRDIVL